MTLASGTKLGPYEILAPLGAGGMGEVYRARDTRLDRDVAVKVLPEEFFEDKERRERFKREAKLLAAVSHPNVAAVHSFEEISGRCLLVQELVEGETLSTRLSGGALPADEVFRLGRQLGEALAHAHERGVIHRDFKSANVIITPEGRAKVLDFGLAKKFSQKEADEATTLSRATLTEAGAIAGTPAYMAPEQLRGLAADSRSDVWALGVVLYEMATGMRPFHGKTGFELTSAILSQQPEPLPSAVPAALQAVIERCLAKEPARRYQRGSEVRAALEAVQSGRAPTPWPALLYSLRRRPWVALAAALAMGLALAVGWWWRTKGGSGAGGKRLAVLPFENLTGDPEQAYLADGIHESLITDLARLSGFSRVIARPSVMAYVKTTKPLAEIGKELGVDTLVTGSVMRAAARLKVTAHLINAATAEHIWSDSFERQPRDILSLQNEIVRAIAQKAKLALTPAERARLATARPVAPEAYEAYLKGRFQLNKMTPEGFEKALAHLGQAAAMDPTSPLPQAALALAYARIGHDRFPDYFARARAAAARAQELGGEPLAEMYQALGEIKLLSDWDYAGAEKDLQRAMELNPSLGDPHRDYSWYLFLIGRRQEAFAEMRRAQELEPLTPLFCADRGWQLWWEGRNDEALAEARKALDLDPRFAYGRAVVGYVLAEKGRFDEAIAEHRKGGEDDPAWRWCLTRTLAQAGRKDDARKLLASFLSQKPEPTGAWDGWFIAETYAALGENDEALRWLEECYKRRHSFLPWVGQNPAYAALRSDARFQDLVRRMNVPAS